MWIGSCSSDGCLRVFFAADVKPVPHLISEARDREVVECAAHVTTRVAGLQAAGEHLIEGGATDDAKAAALRDGPGQPPV